MKTIAVKRDTTNNSIGRSNYGISSLSPGVDNFTAVSIQHALVNSPIFPGVDASDIIFDKSNIDLMDVLLETTPNPDGFHLCEKDKEDIQGFIETYLRESLFQSANDVTYLNFENYNVFENGTVSFLGETDMERYIRTVRIVTDFLNFNKMNVRPKSISESIFKLMGLGYEYFIIPELAISSFCKSINHWTNSILSEKMPKTAFHTIGNVVGVDSEWIDLAQSTMHFNGGTLFYSRETLLKGPYSPMQNAKFYVARNRETGEYFAPDNKPHTFKNSFMTTSPLLMILTLHVNRKSGPFDVLTYFWDGTKFDIVDGIADSKGVKLMSREVMDAYLTLLGNTMNNNIISKIPNVTPNDIEGKQVYRLKLETEYGNDLDYILSNTLPDDNFSEYTLEIENIAKEQNICLRRETNFSWFIISDNEAAALIIKLSTNLHMSIDRIL